MGSQLIEEKRQSALVIVKVYTIIVQSKLGERNVVISSLLIPEFRIVLVYRLLFCKSADTSQHHPLEAAELTNEHQCLSVRHCSVSFLSSDMELHSINIAVLYCVSVTLLCSAVLWSVVLCRIMYRSLAWCGVE